MRRANKSNRFLNIGFMLVSVIIVMLAGCSSPETAVDEGAASVKGLEPYEISWYVLAGGMQRDLELVQNEVNKYLKDKINATLKINILDWGTYQDKMTAMIASGEPFDICFTATWLNDYIGNSLKGAFIPINELIDRLAPKTKAMLGEEFLKASQIDGKNYAIPANKEKARNYGYIYNKNLADKYSFDMTSVKKFADLEPMLKVIKDKETGIVPIIRGKTINDIEWNAANVDEVGLMMPDGKFHNQYETPEFRDAYYLARKFYQEGFYRKDVVVQKDSDQMILNGKFFINAVNLKPGYVDEQNTAYKQNGFQAGQLDITKPTMTNSDTMGSMMAISRTSKNPERAMMFLELFNTDKYLNNLINFGIENKHYLKIFNDVIETQANSGYNVNMQWMFGNQFLNYLQPTENADKWEKFEAYNASAIPALDLGFIFDSEPVKTENAAANNVIKQYKEVLDYGAVEPDEYLPKFIQELKAAGADKIIAEKQKQYDAWKTKNRS